MSRCQQGPLSRLIPALVILFFGTPLVEAQDAAAQEDAEAQAIAQLREAGGIIQNIAANTTKKEAKFHLAGTGVTDEQLAALPKVNELVWLNLRGTKISDAGLQYVGQCKSLTNLQLPLTPITDAGLKHLSGLTELEILNIYGTQVTDAGLAQLVPLTKLRKLYVWQTQVTPAGVAKLREKLPELEVVLGVNPSQESDAEKSDTEKASDAPQHDSKQSDSKQGDSKQGDAAKEATGQGDGKKNGIST